MGDPAIVVKPGGDAANVEVHTPAVDRLAAVSRKLRGDVKTIRATPFDSDLKEAANLLGGIRALAGIIGVLAAQPGYPPTHPEGQATRARMAPLKRKMDEITSKIATTVDLVNPLMTTAPRRMEDRADDCARLAAILLDPANAADIKEVQDDKTIPPSWKAIFFDQLGKSIHEAMIEVLQVKKHEEKMFDAVLKALDARAKNTMIGACLWAGQTAASSVGNLPGPNSLYVGVVRVRAISGLGKLSIKAPSAALDEILPHWFAALKFDATEEATFRTALDELNAEFKALKGLPVTVDSKPHVALVDRAYRTLEDLVKKKGSPHAGGGVSVLVSLLNLFCLFAVYKTMPDDIHTWSWQDFMNIASAGSSTAAGIGVTLVRMKVGFSVMKRFVEHPSFGPGIGYFAAVVSIVNGLIALDDGLEAEDGWMITNGAFQVASGTLLIWGMVVASATLQIWAVGIGLAAAAVSIIHEVLTDNMVQFLTELLAKVKEAKSTFDGSSLMKNIGIAGLIADLEGLIASCKVAVLSCDMTWKRAGGLYEGKLKVDDALKMLGMPDLNLRRQLFIEVWP